MRSQRANFHDSSLDLLLDTITNAFGGILLIAILVVALLQTRGGSIDVPSDTPIESVTELASQLQQLEADLAPLTLEQKALDVISAKLANPKLRSTIDTLETDRQRRDELATEKARILQNIAKQTDHLNTIDSQDKSLTANIKSESSKMEALRSSLEEERSKRKINSPFPEEHPASKRSFSVSIKYGRWYVERSISGTANLDDFIILGTSGEFTTITPKPYKGVPVLEGDKLSRMIIDELNKRDPSKYHIDISIWDDSYVQFQVLRDYLVHHGFDYRLIAVTDGDEIVETFVADPQVQ